MTHKMESADSYHSFMQSPYRSVKNTTYFQVYDELFANYRGKNITFVEIGILDGGSLFMWRDFFGSKARIIGIDFNPEASQWEKDGFEIFIGNQSDPKFWETFFASIGKVDIILDDGGHTFEQQIVTTECCIPFVKDGGLFVVEDTHTSYMPEFGGPSAYSFLAYAKNIVDGINYRFADISKSNGHEYNIYSVRFYESIVAFDIRRAHSRVLSERIDNGREPRGATDFRYANDGILARFLSLGRSLRFLKAIPYLGPFGAKAFNVAFGKLHSASNFWKKRSLKKYFRY